MKDWLDVEHWLQKFPWESQTQTRTWEKAWTEVLLDVPTIYMTVIANVGITFIFIVSYLILTGLKSSNMSYKLSIYQKVI